MVPYTLILAWAREIGSVRSARGALGSSHCRALALAPSPCPRTCTRVLGLSLVILVLVLRLRLHRLRPRPRLSRSLLRFRPLRRLRRLRRRRGPLRPGRPRLTRSLRLLRLLRLKPGTIYTQAWTATLCVSAWSLDAWGGSLGALGCSPHTQAQRTRRVWVVPLRGSTVALRAPSGARPKARGPEAQPAQAPCSAARARARGRLEPWVASATAAGPTPSTMLPVLLRLGSQPAFA